MLRTLLGGPGVGRAHRGHAHQSGTCPRGVSEAKEPAFQDWEQHLQMNEKKSTNQLFQVEKGHLQGLWWNKRFEQSNQGSQDDWNTGRWADTSSCTTLQVKNLHLLLTTMKSSKDDFWRWHWRQSSLVVQGLRIHLAIQGIWVWSQVRELRSHVLHSN